MNKQGKNGIGWCDYTWNPVTGCLKGCSYCYGRKIAERFGKSFEPEFHQKRLEQPLKCIEPSKIFVCSMSDLFGEWVAPEWIGSVMGVTQKCPHHTFQFLTKNPKRYYYFSMNKNCWRGVTITKGEARIFPLIDSGIRFASFEPLLGKVKLRGYPFDWIIVGAMTGQGSDKFAPKKEWVEDIIAQAREKKIPLFLKNNLQWEEKIQQFPKEV